MKTSKLFAAVLFAGTATLALSLPASAAPLLSDTILSGVASASSNVENVQYYPVRRYGYGPGYGYRRGYYRRGYGDTAAGVGIGLAAGAIIGGAEDTADAKIAALNACGIAVAESPADLGSLYTRVGTIRLDQIHSR